MKVLLPTNTTHTIVLEPRFYPSDVLLLEIVKEGYNTTETVTPTYSVLNGVMSLVFDLEGVEQDRFSIKLTEINNVVYRVKLFFTSKEIEDFKLTKDTYIYV